MSGCPFGYGAAPAPTQPAAASAAPAATTPATGAAAAAAAPRADPDQFNPAAVARAQAAGAVYYSSYLGLEKLLDAQKRESVCHDEMLFIITHQTYELWFKEVIFELDSVRELFRDGPGKMDSSLFTMVSRMERILKIQSVLISQVSVIETMTPADFLEFRAHLTPASGFQSWQFRLIENKTGLNSERTFKNKPVYEHLKPDHRDQVRATAVDATLLELVEEWLERCPFINFGDFRFWQAYQTAAEKMLAEDEHTIKNNVLLGPEQKERELKDLETTRQSFASIFDHEVHEQLREQGRRRLSHEATLAALFINLYREYPLLQLPFRLLTALCDMDENWSLWRYRHACMAQRMIGTKIGTGGSAGHAYLHKTVRSTEYRAFVDLENISTYLLPASARPVLPPALVHALQFAHTASSKSFAELAGLSQ